MDTDFKLSNPYYNFELSTNVLLEPKHLNNNLYINLKDNLNKKLKGKCTKYGYISHIYKISEYSDGICQPEDFTGNILYKLKYIAKLCNPIEKTAIICKIDAINKILIKAIYGPIIVIIKKNDYNQNVFKMNNNRDLIIKENILKENDFIVANIIAKKLNYNDTRICAIGYLDRLPTKKEIDVYYKEPNISDEDILNNDLLNISSKDTSESF